MEKVGDSCVVSKLDLAKGFYQIPLVEKSIGKTTFITPFGKYAFTRTPFGLKYAPAMFQHTMEEVLGNLQCCAQYIDDVIVFSSCWEDHLKDLRAVSDVLGRKSLTVKEEKCSFGMKYVEYLGHIVGCGIQAVPAVRSKALNKFKQPETRKQLRSFLSAMSYFRKFLPGYAKLSNVLSPSTSAKAPPRVYTVDGEHAAGLMLCQVTDLCIPVPSDCLRVYTDASAQGVGATLYVVRNDKELTISFYSRQLSGLEKKYCATELEGFAIYLAINNFAPLFYGKQITVRTDHQALVSLLKSRVLNNRLYQWVLKLQMYTFTIEYYPEKENTVADAFIRQCWSSSEAVYQMEDLEEGRVAVEDGCKLVGGGCGAPTPLVQEIDL